MIKDIILQHKKEKEEMLSRDYISRGKLDVSQKFLDKIKNKPWPTTGDACFH